MPAAETLLTVHDTGQSRWQNWHQTVDQPVFRWLDLWNADPNHSTLGGYNNTTRGLQDLIQQALSGDRAIRAHGGTWSFSPVAATDGILLNTRPLNYRFPITADQLHPGHQGTKPLVFVQCGMSVADLNRYLATKQLALQTCGASNGQTIAGAVSTGTHGAALNIGAMQDCVLGLHLITSPTESVWLERQSQPGVTDEVAAHVFSRPIRDDELFNAALVSFGSFGLIHGVLLEVQPMYFLEVCRHTLPLNAAMWDAIRGLDFQNVVPAMANGRQPDHFQIVLNPYDAAENGAVTFMFRRPDQAPGSKPPSIGSSWSQGDSAMEAVGFITDHVPGVTADLAKLLTKLLAGNIDNVCGQPGQVFRDTTTRGKAAGAAMGVPLDRVEEAVRIARQQTVAIEAPALISVRLVKATAATLGFTRHQPVTAIVDLDCPQSTRQQRLFRAVWQAWEAAGIPYTFHWGKLNDLDAAKARRMYGGAVDRWLAARRTLLATPELRRVFSNDFTDRLGLSE
jgi:FAD binding domain-containing protein/D-arabinono-1,4-lactone oxidase